MLTGLCKQSAVSYGNSPSAHSCLSVFHTRVVSNVRRSSTRTRLEWHHRSRTVLLMRSSPSISRISAICPLRNTSAKISHLAIFLWRDSRKKRAFEKIVLSCGSLLLPSVSRMQITKHRNHTELHIQIFTTVLRGLRKFRRDIFGARPRKSEKSLRRASLSKWVACVSFFALRSTCPAVKSP